MAVTLHLLNEDARILERLRHGDEDALVALYRGNRRLVAAFVMRNSGTEEDADDMLQDALVILYERVRSGRFESTAKLSTFIFGTVKNLWLRRLAQKRREVTGLTAEEDGPVSSDPSALDTMIDEEETRHLSQALGRLGEPCRTLLMLFYWEERSMDEIAQVLGFANAATAKAKKYQCKKSLQDLLKNVISHA